VIPGDRCGVGSRVHEGGRQQRPVWIGIEVRGLRTIEGTARRNGVLDAGLRIELFHEFDATPSPTPWLEQGEDGLYRFPSGMHRFPLSYSLRARRVSNL
jgi:hypothetical protein